MPGAMSDLTSDRDVRLRGHRVLQCRRPLPRSQATGAAGTSSAIPFWTAGRAANPLHPGFHRFGAVECVRLELRESIEPGIVDDVGDRVFQRDPLTVAEVPVENAGEALRLGVELLERMVVARLLAPERPELPEHRSRTADLPVRPRQHFGAGSKRRGRGEAGVFGAYGGTRH